jgi:Domain of unknown function (DUF4169)
LMGDIINLKSVRKQRARDAKAQEADANRLKFGRRKTQKERDERNAAQAEKTLDGHKIER